MRQIIFDIVTEGKKFHASRSLQLINKQLIRTKTADFFCKGRSDFNSKKLFGL